MPFAPNSFDFILNWYISFRITTICVSFARSNVLKWPLFVASNLDKQFSVIAVCNWNGIAFILRYFCLSPLVGYFIAFGDTINIRAVATHIEFDLTIAAHTFAPTLTPVRRPKWCLDFIIVANCVCVCVRCFAFANISFSLHLMLSGCL